MTSPEADEASTPHSSTRGRRPLVSVIVPVFNAAPFLEEAIRSILDQDYDNKEVVAVDDGSTDGSQEILKAFGSSIRVIHGENRGPAAARNIGVREAKGDYLAFHDADDLWLPGKLRSQVDYMVAHPEMKITFGRFVFWYQNEEGRFPSPKSLIDRPETWEIEEPFSGWLYVDLLRDSIIHIITAVIRREVFDSVGGFDEYLRGGSDYDFWLKSCAKFQAHKIDQCMALYRMVNSGVTATPKQTNYPFVVLQRAVATTGLVGPDGRQVSNGEIQSRFGHMWFSFAKLHLEKGDSAEAKTALLRYLGLSKYRPSALFNVLTVVVRAWSGRLLWKA